MKRLRSWTLLGRTAALLGLLMLVSQVLWLGIAAYFFVRPIDRIYQQNIAMVVDLARLQVEQNPDADEFAPGEYFRVVRDSEPRPEFGDVSGSLFAELTATLRARYGESVAIRKERNQSALWIRFPVGPDDFWAVVPKGIPPIPYFMLASVGVGIAVTIAGAYIIIFNLTKRLRTLTNAVQAFGRGEPTIPMDETGPLEIMNLNRGFNQMAVDLKKLDDDRRIMLAGISHDLKTPLTRLRLAAELSAPDADSDLAAGMVHDIEDMDSILKQFLDYARDGAEEQPVLSDLNVVVSDVCERYRSSGHEIASHLPDIPPLRFRKLAIYRAITNLVDNAVRYGRNGVEVETRADGDHVSVIIRDTGPGIRTGNPDDYIKAFVREDISRSEPGTGLGLTIVGRIIRTHGGSLHLENRTTGGLLVRIDLPREKSG